MKKRWRKSSYILLGILCLNLGAAPISTYGSAVNENKVETAQESRGGNPDRAKQEVGDKAAHGNQKGNTNTHNEQNTQSQHDANAQGEQVNHQSQGEQSSQEHQGTHNAQENNQGSPHESNQANPHENNQGNSQNAQGNQADQSGQEGQQGGGNSQGGNGGKQQQTSDPLQVVLTLVALFGIGSFAAVLSSILYKLYVSRKVVPLPVLYYGNREEGLHE